RVRDRADDRPVRGRLRVPVRALRPDRARLPARGPALRTAHEPTPRAARLLAQPRGEPGRRPAAPAGQRALDPAPRVVRAAVRRPARLPGLRPARAAGGSAGVAAGRRRAGLAGVGAVGADLLALPGDRARPG